MSGKNLTLKFSTLSSFAIEVLGQLFVKGPIWDGNVASKSGRGELVKHGLAHHEHGFAFLTPEGLQTAIEWDLTDKIKRGDSLAIAWHRKACGR